MDEGGPAAARRANAPTRLFSGVRPPAGVNAASRPLAVARDGSRIYWPQAIEQPDAGVIHVRTHAVR